MTWWWTRKQNTPLPPPKLRVLRAEALGLLIPGNMPLEDAVHALLDEIERLQKELTL